MHKDVRALIKACQECQVHKPVPRNPQEKLNPISSLWPFYKWSIDIAGPFPEGPEKVKFLIVAMDYFTKWIEAKPIWSSGRNHIRQWEAIPRQPIQRLVREIVYSIAFFFRKTSPDKRTGRKSKLEFGRGNKSKAG
ncbi:reverse transcriptase domain-containing protein [Tanacetum coccineum]